MSNLKICEGIAGVWRYHFTTDEKSLKALCGAQTMPTGIPLNCWGQKGHLRETYCKECERLRGELKPKPNRRQPRGNLKK